MDARVCRRATPFSSQWTTDYNSTTPSWLPGDRPSRSGHRGHRGHRRQVPQGALTRTTTLWSKQRRRGGSNIPTGAPATTLPTSPGQADRLAIACSTPPRTRPSEPKPARAPAPHFADAPRSDQPRPTKIVEPIGATASAFSCCARGSLGPLQHTLQRTVAHGLGTSVKPPERTALACLCKEKTHPFRGSSLASRARHNAPGPGNRTEGKGMRGERRFGRALVYLILEY